MKTDSQRRRDRMIATLSPKELRSRGLARFHTEIGPATDAQLDAWWGDERPRRQPMFAILDLEFRGADVADLLGVKGLRPWVAAVTFDGMMVRERLFLRSETDYSEADSTGGTGVVLRFSCQHRRVYEVYDRARPRGPRRLFMANNGNGWDVLTVEQAARMSKPARHDLSAPWRSPHAKGRWGLR